MKRPLVRVQVSISAELVKALDDFRFQFRLSNRAAAVRQLLQRGMVTEGAKPRLKTGDE